MSVKGILGAQPKQLLTDSISATVGAGAVVTLPKKINDFRPGLLNSELKVTAAQIIAAVLASYAARRLMKQDRFGVTTFAGGMGVVGLKALSRGANPLIDKVAGAGTGARLRSALADPELEEDLTSEDEEDYAEYAEEVGFDENLSDDAAYLDDEGLGAGAGLVTSGESLD